MADLILDPLDPLDLDFVSIPFPETADFQERRELDAGLKASTFSRPLLKPIAAFDFNSWEGEGEFGKGTEMIAPSGFERFDGVSNQFGPGGGGSEKFQLHVHITATKPPVNRMTLVTNRGENITVMPSAPRRTVTKGDVELTVARWMEKQRALPPVALNKHDVETGLTDLTVRGTNIQVSVWYWRGLEQIPGRRNTWKIHL